MSGAVPAAPFRFERFTGTGLAILRRHDHDASISAAAAVADFSHLAFTFPLKLICPRSASHDATARIARAQRQSQQQHDRQSTELSPSSIKPVAALYVVGYGGGLVSGDAVSMDMDVGRGCSLLLLTQGSTKVYKMRAKADSLVATPSNQRPAEQITSQTLRCIVRPNATLVVLPDPVTCFAEARYSQTQRIDLRDGRTSSLILLDWLTPGRVHWRGDDGRQPTSSVREMWSFNAYQSRNEVRVDGQGVIARDVLLLLNDGKGDDNDGMLNSVAQRCEPYMCYATLLLYGPDAADVIQRTKRDFHAVQQRSRTKAGMQPQELLWSCSPLATTTMSTVGNDGGLIVRVAGLDTELVRDWLRQRLASVKEIIGDDLYRAALG